jgi:hypothetical protein
MSRYGLYQCYYRSDVVRNDPTVQLISVTLRHTAKRRSAMSRDLGIDDVTLRATSYRADRDLMPDRCRGRRDRNPQWRSTAATLRYGLYQCYYRSDDVRNVPTISVTLRLNGKRRSAMSRGRRDRHKRCYVMGDMFPAPHLSLRSVGFPNYALRLYERHCR